MLGGLQPLLPPLQLPLAGRDPLSPRGDPLLSTGEAVLSPSYPLPSASDSPLSLSDLFVSFGKLSVGLRRGTSAQ